MTDAVLAFDLGTSGCKASLWTAEGEALGDYFESYSTFHPRAGYNEQRPEDWWSAVVRATRALLESATSPVTISGVAVSGQSLGCVLLDGDGRVIRETTPIWSDSRAAAQADAVFARNPETEWYRRTGNGFGAALYPVFKSAWFAQNDPGAWAKTRRIIGSKDLVNYWLTGEIATDHSYASGSGAYDLTAMGYDDGILAAVGLDRGLFIEPVASTTRIGSITADSAAATGIPAGTPVFAGAVDNACMALGSRCTSDGRVYASLGSSSWVTIASSYPVIDTAARPFVFAHAVPGLYISALSTFSSGTTVEWLRDAFAPGAEMQDFLDLGCKTPLGARGLTILPMFAGGTPLEGGPRARGVIHGLDLAHGVGDFSRAGMEGVALSLRRALEVIGTPSEETELMIAGGGSRHPGWNQLYADVFNMALVRTQIGQQAAAFGAAMIALVGTGQWNSFERADAVHSVAERYMPDEVNVAAYNEVYEDFNTVLSNSPPARALT